MKRIKQLQELGWGMQEICELLEELKSCMRECNTRNQTKMDQEKRIVNILNDIGIPFGLKGREYIIEGIKYGLVHKNFKITSDLYPYLESMFKTSESSVDKAIKLAIKRAAAKKKKLFYVIFNPYMKGEHIRNKEFFYGIISYLKTTQN